MQAVEHGDTQELKPLITSKDLVGVQMHKTLLTFNHNLKAVLNGAALPYSMAALKASIAKLHKLREQLSAILILLIS